MGWDGGEFNRNISYGRGDAFGITSTNSLPLGDVFPLRDLRTFALLIGGVSKGFEWIIEEK